MKILNYRSEKEFTGLRFDYFEDVQEPNSSDVFIKIGGKVVFCP